MSSETEMRGVIDMMKKLGIKVDGLEFEAQEIWGKLEDMSKNNPIEYQRFVDETLKQDPNQTDDKSISFRPDAGFAVKCQIIDGKVTTKKISDINETIPFFINFVSHNGIDVAKTSHGKAASKDDFLRTDDVEVPFIIGKPREFIYSESCKGEVIDVVLHTSVINFAISNGYTLKSNIINLVISTLQAEINVALGPTWENLPEKYLGGHGNERIVPVMFFIEDKNNTNNSSSNNNNNNNTSQTQNQDISISTILREKKNQNDTEVISQLQTKIAANNKPSSSSIIIEDILANHPVKQGSKNQSSTTILANNMKTSNSNNFIFKKVSQHVPLYSFEETATEIVLKIEQLNTNFKISEAIIDISATKIIITLYKSNNDSDIIIEASTSVCFCVMNTKASFSKKKNQLNLTVGYNNKK